MTRLDDIERRYAEALKAPHYHKVIPSWKDIPWLVECAKNMIAIFIHKKKRFWPHEPKEHADHFKYLELLEALPLEIRQMLEGK